MANKTSSQPSAGNSMFTIFEESEQQKKEKHKTAIWTQSSVDATALVYKIRTSDIPVSAHAHGNVVVLSKNLTQDQYQLLFS